MYFITIKRMLEVCFSAHPNIQYRAFFYRYNSIIMKKIDCRVSINVIISSW